MDVVDNGLIRDSGDVLATDRLIKMKSTHNVWDVIEECVKIWSARHPTHWKSYLFHVADIRETRKEKKFASTTDKVTGGVLRYTIDFPYPVYAMVRALYTPDELEMDREFFQAIGRKFPRFRIAEKQ